MSDPSIDRSYVLATLDDLVATNSVNPTVGKGPGERVISNLLLDRLASIGRLDVRKQHVVDDRWNVIATLKGTGGGRSLLMNGHMDTVGVEGMTIEPFKPYVKDGLLHGRGACDMKGGIAAMVGAAKSLSDSRLRGDVIFTFVVDEEHLSVGIEKLIEDYRADAAIVGEPSEMHLAPAHKGFVWVEIDFKGRSAHGSVPERGIDAITHATKLVARLPELQTRLNTRQHPLLGPPKIHTSTIAGGVHWSIVPDHCVLRLERRTIPGETTASVMAEIQQVLDGLKKQDADFNVTARAVFGRPPLETGADAPIVQDLQRVIGEVGQGEVKLVGVPYWSDGAVLSSSGAIPTCIFGPGDIRVAHAPDEYVNIEDVYRAAEIYSKVAKKFCA